MTPKQKALQLVDSFTMIDEFTTNGSKIYYHDSIKCALIALDEIMSALTYLPYGLDYLNKICYWEEVKQEIEAL